MVVVLRIHSAPPTDFGRPREVRSPMFPGDPDKPEDVPVEGPLVRGVPPSEAKFQLDEKIEEASPSQTDFGRLAKRPGALTRFDEDSA